MFHWHLIEIVGCIIRKCYWKKSNVLVSFLKLSQNDLLQLLPAAGAVLKCKQTNWRASSSTDGKLKMWVYGVAAGAFVLLIFIVSMIYLAWWVDEFNFPYLSSSSPFTKPNRPHFFFPPPALSWSTPSITVFLLFLFPSHRPLVSAAATVPRCIALLRPKSLTPTGRRSGWAKTHMRWFTPAPIAKSWLKAAPANEDVEGSPPPKTHTLQYKYLQSLTVPRDLSEKCHMSCLTSRVKVLVQVRTNHPLVFSPCRPFRACRPRRCCRPLVEVYWFSFTFCFTDF